MRYQKKPEKQYISKMVTYNAMKHQVAEYIAAGFDGHLPKPVSIEALYNTLTGCLRRPAGGK